MMFTTSVVRQNYPNFVIRSNFVLALLKTYGLILTKLICKAREKCIFK